MGRHRTTNSQASDFHLFSFSNKMPKSKSKSIKEMSKAYKSLVSKKHHDKKEDEGITAHQRFVENDDKKRVDEDIWSPKFLSRVASRRSKTPTPQTKSLFRIGSRRCTTPTPTSLSRSSSPSKNINDNDDNNNNNNNNSSSSGNNNNNVLPEISSNPLKRILSRRGTTSGPLLRSNSKLEISGPELIYHAGSHRHGASSIINDMGMWIPGDSENVPEVSVSSNLSRRLTTPILFSQTTVRRKPPEVEKIIECTLEDLCFGCTKKIKVTRDVIKHPGVMVQEIEILKIEVKPGWRKGTKIKFEGKGDEKPGYLPADIVFIIEEKKHNLFRREGNNDLEICIEIPLVDALTGCSLPIPVLGGEKLTLSFENTVVYPGYVKVIEGQGMPTIKNDGKRGDLHVKFLVDFPKELSDEQRQETFRILENCC
ncbi:uncharacterized protein LOC130958102 [Arachis stenosperma]|uniref:uncharacterized protein LOC130958102 n=1 Tax=Arachis stenosperma TaxID=217475 RepID=UPI0025ABFCAC|nr:uncharacterized protein LOC130958102 [Arachis stenosperma]